MYPSRWTTRASALVIPLVAAALTGATCTKAAKERPQTATSAETPPANERSQTATSAAPTPDSGAGGSGAAPSSPDAAKAVLSGIPGMDFSALNDGAKKELATVFTDEFCYCGCPHTLGACLKTHSSCKHAKRMALLAATEVSAGGPATSVINSLSKYYQSFSKGRATLKPDDRMCQGPKDANVTVVEFSDFECPHCLAAVPVVEGLVKGGKARLCWLPFPLVFPHSQLTAQAAFFARDNGKFWPVHDALFEQQMTMSPEVVHSVLTKNGLNVSEFKKAVASGKYLAEINAAKESGRVGGVNSTPTVFLEGRRFDLPLTPELLEHTVDDEREWQANSRGWAAD